MLIANGDFEPCPKIRGKPISIGLSQISASSIELKFYDRSEMAKRRDMTMPEQAKQSSSNDLLQKEYHEIGIPSVAAACCVKKHVEAKHTDYDPVREKK